MWTPFKNKVALHNFLKEISRVYRKLEKRITVKNNNVSIYSATNYKKHYENAKREFEKKWSLLGR